MKTFSKQNDLASLPIPSLDITLSKYLDSVKPLLSSEEFSSTSGIVYNFEKGIGKELHNSFLNDSKNKRNWLEKLWYDKAYLEYRVPIYPYFCVAGLDPHFETSFLSNKDLQLKNAALAVYTHIKFWNSLRHQTVEIEKTGSGVFLCMNQYKFIYNGYQKPGLNIDTLHKGFKTADEGQCDSDVIAICNGRLFVLKTMHDDCQVSVNSLKRQFEYIRNTCDGKGTQSLGLLTTDDRNAWAKNYEHLKSLHVNNKNHLEKILKSAFLIVLENDSPANFSEALALCLSGNSSNRWADKCSSLIIFANGMVGSSLNHAGYDGVAWIEASNYCDVYLKEMSDNYIDDFGQYFEPRELNFIMDSLLLNSIEGLAESSVAACSNIDSILQVFYFFGIDFIRALKCHPDCFVQLAIQMTYYRLHQKPVPVYESGSLRKYWNGRTETIRSCTVEAITWIKAMLDESVCKNYQYELFQIASRKHLDMIRDVMKLRSCDRHLLALRTIAKSNDFEDPEIFSDPAWQKSGGDGNFVLSTSSTGFSKNIGGCAAMCQDGYGVFYNFHHEQMNFVVTSYKDSIITDHKLFILTLFSSLKIMKDLIETIPNNAINSKL